MSISNVNSKYNVSFGVGVTQEFKLAEKIVKDIVNQGWQSSTFMKDVRYDVKLYKNHEKRALAMLKIAEMQSLIFTYRRAIAHILKFDSTKECFDCIQNIIKEARSLNCLEYSFLSFLKLKDAQIPCRIVSDPNIDHCFVVVNRKEPFTSYRDAKKGEFVVDAWIKKVYKSVQEAYLDYKKSFSANYNCNLVDRTEKPYPYCIISGKADKLKREEQLKKINESLSKVRATARSLRKLIPYELKRIEYKINGRLIDEYMGEMDKY